MNRRQFLKGLLASTAVAAVAPAMLERGTVLTIDDIRRCIDTLRGNEIAWTGRFYTAVVHGNTWHKVLIDDFAPDDEIIEVELHPAEVGRYEGVRFIDSHLMKPMEAA